MQGNRWGKLTDGREDFTPRNADTNGRYYIRNGQVSTRLSLPFGDGLAAVRPNQRMYRHEGWNTMEWVIIVNEDGDQEPVQITGWDTDHQPTRAITVSDTGVVRYVFPEEMVKIQ